MITSSLSSGARLGRWRPAYQGGLKIRRRRRARRVLRAGPVIVAASIACMAAGVMIAAQVGWFPHGSPVHGATLIHKERRAIAAATVNPMACQASAGRAGPAHPAHRTPARSAATESGPASGSGPGPRGLLEAPALDLVAPVQEGAGDALLSDAVGHIPASAWPGRPGTSVFAAHDVTWFSGIDRLKAGDEIRYVTPCRTYTYRVTAHRVAAAGSPVYSTATPSIVLDTRYPLNALYLTSTRYLVYATLTTTSPTSVSRTRRPGSPQFTVPVPAALAAQGVAAGQTSGSLGVFRVAGSPSWGWRQTSAPFEAETAALTAYFGMIHSAEQGQRTWWAVLAPSVPVSAAAGLWGNGIKRYDAPIGVTLRVQGYRTLGAVLNTALTTGGPARPGIYALTVAESVAGRHLVVSKFTMKRISS
jgi:sortase A